MNPWKRKEVIGNATLYLGDCLEILPHLPKVDAVITDPPYGIEGGKGGDSQKYQKGFYVAAFNDDEQYIKATVIPVIAKLVETGAPLAVTCGTRWLQDYPKATEMGCFWTPAAATHGRWGFTTFQPILYYGKDWRQGKCALPSGLMVTEAAEKNGHPCPKPIRAWTWLVDKVAPLDATVLDPFMGSGTTAVACHKTNRPFIGIEIEPKYFEIACERIENAQRQQRMFA